MGDYFAIDALGEAFEKTKAFFRGGKLLKKWLKLALLVWVVNLLSGGGGNSLDFSRDIGSEEIPQISQYLAQIDLGFVIAAAAVILAIIIILSILLRILRNACFFSILESISLNEVRVRAYLRKFLGLAVSLTIFEIIIGILSIPVFLCWAVAIFGIIMRLFPAAGNFLMAASGGSQLVASIIQVISNPIVLVIAALAGILGLIFFLIIGYVLGQFGSYIMYRENRKAFDAFKKGLLLAIRNLKQVAVLIIVQICFVALLIALAFLILIIVIIPAIIVAMIFAALTVGAMLVSPLLILPIILLATAAMLIFSYVGTCIFLPIDVFFYYYNLAFLEKLLGGGAEKMQAKPATAGAGKKFK